jgi:localization factor PodJL
MAQYRLAKLYESGHGVEADLVLARQWTERAAAASNRNAIHDLGVYYARGEGAPRDDATAFRLFQQAAELDLADSQFNLGVLYEQGRGVEANPGEALFWFMLAARQGDAAAAERVTALQAALTRFEVEQAEARLAVFRPNPADPIANGVFAPPAPPLAPAAAESAEPAAPATPLED